MIEVRGHWSEFMAWEAVRVARRVGRTGCPLSAREREMLGWFASGEVASAKQVAARMGIEVKTVHNLVASSARALGTSGKLQTVIVAMQHGWVVLPAAEAA